MLVRLVRVSRERFLAPKAPQKFSWPHLFVLKMLKMSWKIHMCTKKKKKICFLNPPPPLFSFGTPSLQKQL